KNIKLIYISALNNQQQFPSLKILSLAMYLYSVLKNWHTNSMVCGRELVTYEGKNSKKILCIKVIDK
ncbi:hypothetical protein, partial [Salmonella enterica]|uniref:hypothetical protein n=1 Tax=Salmonella enterica TaxID=28901 RepID=UPI003EDBB1E8